jgi:IclR family mhp operon transcriptional activator
MASISSLRARALSSLAALNLVFPRAAVSERDLQQRFVPALLRLAETIGRGSRAWIE